MALRIEIARTYREGMWELRIGDISGHIACTNISFEEVIDNVRHAMQEADALYPKSKNRTLVEE